MKSLSITLLAITVLFCSKNYYGNSTAPVVIAGAIIKAKSVEPIHKKYKRKDCPVCKGKGWYMSGDKLQKISCDYCEPDKGDKLDKPQTIIRKK